MIALICTSAAAQEVEGVAKKQLRVGTREIPPFSIKNDEGAWNGVSIDLWREIAVDLEVESEFVEYTSVSELLAAVQRNEVDVAVAAITVTAEREQQIDFSLPFYTSGLGVAVRKSDMGSLYLVLLSLLSIDWLKVLAGFFTVLLVIGLLAWIFERRNNHEHFDRRPVHGIWDGFWFAAVTMTTVGYGDKSPKSVAGRLLALVWMFVGLVIISLFTAAATSALTQASLLSRIERTEDLVNYRCGTVNDTTSQHFLRDENISYVEYATLDEALQALIENKIDACIYDAPTLRYVSHMKLGGVVEVLPVRFQSASYAFALPAESPLRESVNRTLLREIEKPGWQDLVERLMGR
ncbi:MAG: transporter substrate-binding domain-containing protein [Rubripirellula sp.]